MKASRICAFVALAATVLPTPDIAAQSSQTQPSESSQSKHDRSESVARSTKQLDQLADQFPGVAVAVWGADGQLWRAERGFARLNSPEPVTGETQFNIYSTSKALLGLAFARLVQSGQVSMQATVGELAPDLPRHWHSITIEDILAHRSGIRHYQSPLDWLQFAQLRCSSPREALAYFSEDPLVGHPGEAESYSTFAFVLASELLLRITGADDFQTALNDALGPPHDFKLDSFERDAGPLLMEASQIPEPLRPEGATGIIELPRLSAECKFGGGGIVSNAADLARAGTLAFIDRTTGKSPIRNHQTRSYPLNSITLGGAVNSIEIEANSWTSYSLSGGAPGGRSYLLVLIEPKLSVAITANADGPSLDAAALEVASAWIEYAHSDGS